MKLYIANGSASLAAQVVANEAEVPVEIHHVDLQTNVTAGGQDFSCVNPHGHVPVLDFEDGFFLSEIVAINEYLADRRPELRLMPPIASRERLALIELQSFIATGLHQQFVTLLQGQVQPELEHNLRAALVFRLAHLERRLTDGRTFLTGETFTVADAYLFAVLPSAARVAIDLAQFPALSAYRDRVAQRPSVERACRDAANAALCDAAWAA